MKPRRHLRGQTDLGRAIDERGKRKGARLHVYHDTGSATAAPLGQGAGGGSGGQDPALPEKYVRSLNVPGEDALSDALVLTGAGGTEIGQSISAPHFTISSPLAVWHRTSSVLSPTNSGDRLLVSAESPMGAIQVGALGSGNPAILADTNLSYAIVARSTANLGLKLDGVSDIKLLNGDDVNNAPAGYARWHSLANGRACVVDEDGNRHDLSVQHKQCFSGQRLASQADGESWDYAAYPVGAAAAAVTATAILQFDFGTGRLVESYGRWSWQASYMQSPPSLTQAQIATGLAFRKFGDGANRDGNCRVVVNAKLRVNDVSFFDSVQIVLNGTSSSAFVNVLGQLSNEAWSEVSLSLSGVDVSSWNTDLRASVWAQGKQHTEAGDYPTSIDIERISIEQWIN